MIRKIWCSSFVFTFFASNGNVILAAVSLCLVQQTTFLRQTPSNLFFYDSVPITCIDQSSNRLRLRPRSPRLRTTNLRRLRKTRSMLQHPFPSPAIPLVGWESNTASMTGSQAPTSIRLEALSTWALAALCAKARCNLLVRRTRVRSGVRRPVALAEAQVLPLTTGRTSLKGLWGSVWRFLVYNLPSRKVWFSAILYRRKTRRPGRPNRNTVGNGGAEWRRHWSTSRNRASRAWWVAEFSMTATSRVLWLDSKRIRLSKATTTSSPSA